MGWHKRGELGIFHDGGDASQRQGRRLWKHTSLSATGVDERSEALTHVRIADELLVDLHRADVRRYASEDLTTDPPTLLRSLGMYGFDLPEIEACVMVKYLRITYTGVEVSLLEYGGVEGHIVPSELTAARGPQPLASLVRVGRKDPAVVLRVDREHGYVDLSRRHITEKEARACSERYEKSKVVQSVLLAVAKNLKVDPEQIYRRVGWQLHSKYGHAYKALQLLTVAVNPDEIFDSLGLEVEEGTGCEDTKVVPLTDIKSELVKEVMRRRKPIKIRADIEMICSDYDGIIHIQDAIRKAESSGTSDHSVKVQLIAAPLYFFNTEALTVDDGVAILTKAIEACTADISSQKGNLVVRVPPRAVSGIQGRLFLDNLQSDGASEDPEED